VAAFETPPLGEYPVIPRVRADAMAHSAFYRRFHAGLHARPLEELPVLTKADQVPRGRRAARATAIALAIGLAPDDMVVTSARSREGQEELREAVLAFLE